MVSLREHCLNMAIASDSLQINRKEMTFFKACNVSYWNNRNKCVRHLIGIDFHIVFVFFCLYEQRLVENIDRDEFFSLHWISKSDGILKEECSRERERERERESFYKLSNFLILDFQSGIPCHQRYNDTHVVLYNRQHDSFSRHF